MNIFLNLISKIMINLIKNIHIYTLYLFIFKRYRFYYFFKLQIKLNFYKMEILFIRFL